MYRLCFNRTSALITVAALGLPATALAALATGLAATICFAEVLLGAGPEGLGALALAGDCFVGACLAMVYNSDSGLATSAGRNGVGKHMAEVCPASLGSRKNHPGCMSRTVTVMTTRLTEDPLYI